MREACADQLAVLREKPDDPVALLALGRCQVEADRSKDAAITLRHLLSLAPQNAMAAALLAAALVRMGDVHEAARLARAACLWRPDCAEAQLQRCWVERRLGNLAAAIEAGQRAVAIEPTPDGYNYLSFALLSNDNVQEALAATEACLALDPRNIAALNYRSSALAAAGRSAEGRKLTDFERFLWLETIDSVDGYANVRQFNREITAQVLAAPGRQLDPLQTEDLMDPPRGAAVALKAIADAATRYYLSSLPKEDPTHPFLRFRPSEWTVYAWGTRTSQFDMQEHHIHQHAWLSGVYYASVPENVGRSREELGGCIEFARFLQYSDRPIQTEAVVLPPHEGMIVMFPSYFPHRVLPFRSDSVRVSLAFNIIPTWGGVLVSN